MDSVATILSHGDDEQREALRAFASALLDAEAMDVASDDVPGLPARPSRTALVRALRRNAERTWTIRRTLYAQALTYREAAERLGVSTNQITNLVREGDLLALDGSEGLKLPGWQFHPESRRGRLPGIRRVAAAFPGRLLGLSAWMIAANPALGGRTPAEALVDGDVDLVCAAAGTQP